MGTFVYPNALAGAILLLLPVSLALAFNSTRQLKPPIRGAVIAMTCLLGGLGLFWSGSKAGWLIGMALAGIWLFRLNWSARLKWAMLTTVLRGRVGSVRGSISQLLHRRRHQRGRAF